MLKRCRECEGTVSTQAGTCPHCGAPRPACASYNGAGFEWKSQLRVAGIPLVHVAFGRDASGRLRVARGIIAIGQFAVGLITVAQFGVGVLFGFGQFMTGLVCVSQFALALGIGVGQIATGVVAIGQFALAGYGLAQFGVGAHLWSLSQADPEAVAFFRSLWPW